jgi:hypothetical protein
VEQAARIRGDRFQIAALGLGIEGGESERRLAGSRHAGEHDQGVARYVDIGILEIVLAPRTRTKPEAVVSRIRTSCAPDTPGRSVQCIVGLSAAKRTHRGIELP